MVQITLGLFLFITFFSNIVIFTLTFLLLFFILILFSFFNFLTAVNVQVFAIEEKKKKKNTHHWFIIINLLPI